MAVVIQTPIVWATNGAAIQVQPAPLITNRPPTSADTGPIGAVWIDSSTLGVYALARVHGSSTWVTSPGSGSGTFTDVTVSPGDLIVDTGATDLQALTVQGVANFSTDVNFNGGVITINADLDLSSASAIELVSTSDTDPALLLDANGGTTSTVILRNQTGTAVDSLEVSSTVGGVTIASGLASADAINIAAASGGIDIDGALLVAISSSRNNAQAILIEASAGGIDMTATGTAGEDIDITATGSSVNISATEADTNAITIHASDAAGGVKIRAGSNGIEIGNDADCAVIDLGDIAPSASRLITAAGGTVITAVTDRVDIAPDGVSTNASAVKQVDVAAGNVLLGTSTVNINSGTAASGTSTVNISTGTGGGTKVVNLGNADALTTFNVDAITLINDSVNANVSICTGTSTGGIFLGNAAADTITLDSASSISLDAADNSNFTVVGGDLTLESTTDTLSLSGGAASSSAVVIASSDVAGGIDIDAGTGGITIDSTGAISLDGTASSNFSVSGASVDLSLVSAGGQLIMNAEEAAANALRMLSVAGGLDVDTGLAIDIHSTGGNVAMSTASGTMLLDCTGVLELNSSAGIISVGNDAVNQNINLGTAGARTITIGNGTGATSVVVDSGSGALNLGTNAVAHTVTLGSVTGVASTVIQSGTGDVIVTSTDAVTIDSAGVLELNSSAGVIGIGNDAVSQNINIGTAGARAISIGNTTGATSVTVACGTGGVSIGASATAHTTTLGGITTTSTTNIQSGTGGVNLNGAGITTVVSSDNTIASPTASTTLNVNVGSATFTGFTTAAAGTQDFTITNSLVTTSSKILCTVCNEGANDAQVNIRRITRAAGSFVVKVVNDGAAAVNGNIIITFWVLS